MTPARSFFALLSVVPLVLGAGEDRLEGFSLASLNVDRAQLVAGGPGRDGIESVDAPKFVAINEATWLGGQTEVLGITVAGRSHAYPVRMLEFHQVVNDTVGDVPVLVSYGPLAGTPAAYRCSVDGRVLSFGVSGLIYNHNFLLYDRETESLWSQFTGRAIAGKLAGKTLDRVTVRQETTARWVQRAPDSQFLRPPNPEKFHYPLSPYAAYWLEDKALFPVAAKDDRYHAKELVLGVVSGGVTRAYLGSQLTRAGGRAQDTVGEAEITVHYDTDTGTFGWETDADDVAVFEAYWLVWKAFHPKTEVWGDAPDAGAS